MMFPRYTKFNSGHKKDAHIPPTNKFCLIFCPKTLTLPAKPFTIWPLPSFPVLYLQVNHISNLLSSQKGNCFFIPPSLCPFCSHCLEMSPTPFLHFLHLQSPEPFKTSLECPASSVASPSLLSQSQAFSGPEPPCTSCL